MIFFCVQRSSKTGVNKCGGVTIWVPGDISSKQRNDLNVLNESFFESLWVEISGLSVNKILINASYCPNKNLGNYFIDELTSEISSAYSITDEILLFGDYNLNYFNKRLSTLLDEFASNSGLTLSNTEKPTRATSQGVTLIDHGFSSKNQIQDVQILFPHQLKWITWLFCTLPFFLLNLKTGSKVLSVGTKESSMQIKLVSIFQIRSGVTYIIVKMEIKCTMFS